MGEDAGRAATGLAYLSETLTIQENVYATESDPNRRCRRGLALAQTLMQIGMQHHQQQDAETALTHFQRAVSLVQAFMDVYDPMLDRARANDSENIPPKLVQAVEYARFVQSEVH